jgi:hypothetical protein
MDIGFYNSNIIVKNTQKYLGNLKVTYIFE